MEPHAGMDSLINDDTEDTETKDEDASQPSEENASQTPTTSHEQTQRMRFTKPKKEQLWKWTEVLERADEGRQILKTVDNRDEKSMYGEFIGYEMRKFPLATQTYVKHILANVLFKAALGEYENRTPSITLLPFIVSENSAEISGSEANCEIIYVDNDIGENKEFPEISGTSEELHQFLQFEQYLM
ncbi:uncharacterized protein LOC124803323 [Schistocerca piceifrons]|uniref:uncharacterized protein LOC124770360 n=1 Tax=Schistocerca piceifrons TaxID=274613 RepID=UPI001F5FC8C4|nr:uncharacterized protein LOC124770360 [Schistocerca piceifrons]XP_047120463.1 uncharacterized protein LOC124803323 [Schistocerca piceifrons]